MPVSDHDHSSFNLTEYNKYTVKDELCKFKLKGFHLHLRYICIENEDES